MTDQASATSHPSDRPVRTRIAPSPTGFVHVGNARSALYNWLYARQHAGVFVLRIEDTDQARHVEDAVEGVQQALRWLGLNWDEGPHRQSQRMKGYKQAAQTMFDNGQAYWCDLTPEQIEQRAKQRGRPGYDGYSRDRNLAPGPGRVLRFKVPEGTTTIHDMVRGEVVFEHEHIDDFVILRSNGTPVFHLAVTVDDLVMDISHVIRGEEHLSNTPKQIMLWQALTSSPTPTFAHLPLLVNERRQKLSKRRDRVALEDFRAQGYLPEAMDNYLALLGWSPGDNREIFSLAELVDVFQLEDVKSAPAFFDLVKLTNVNAQYVRALNIERFMELSAPYLPDGGSWDRIRPIAEAVQERSHTLVEVASLTDFFFVADDELVLDESSWGKAERADTTPHVLQHALSAYQQTAWDAESLHSATTALAEDIGLNLRKAQAPIRVATTGRAVGPPLFESLALLGRASVLTRLTRALHRVQVSQLAASVDRTQEQE